MTGTYNQGSGFAGSIGLPKGQSYTSAQFAALGGASVFGAGYVTIDGQLNYCNGIAAFPVNNQIGTKGFKNNATLIGDSFLAFGVGPNTNTSNSLIVSGGIATLNTASNVVGTSGQIVHLYHNGDPSNPLDGACIPIIGIPNTTSISVSATVNGVTLPDGAYPGNWTVNFPSTNSWDGSVIRAIQMMTGNKFRFGSSYCIVGIPTQKMLDMLPKILSGPEFRTAFLCGGTNDINGSIGSEGAAIIAATNAFNNLKTICETLLLRGVNICWIVSPPQATSVGSARIKNLATRHLRELILSYYKANEKFADQLTVWDLYGEVLDNSTTNDGSLANYLLTADGVHITSYGQYKIAKSAIAKGVLKNLFGARDEMIGRNPISGIAITAWATSTAYTVGLLRKANGDLFRCTVAGTSASSGTGPSGQGTGIVDGTAQWEYVSYDWSSFLANGQMLGTSGTFNGAIQATNFGGVGTVPTSWQINSCSATITGGTTTGNDTKYAAAPGSTSERNGGKAWTLVLPASGAGTLNAYQAIANSNLKSGRWYRFGFTLTAIADSPSLTNATMRVGITAGGAPIANQNGNNTTTIPMLAGDQLDVWSEPFYYDGTAGSTNLFIGILVTTGTTSVQLSDAFYNQVQSPAEEATVF